jgi:predicted Zn finger-like uncharacterized protein
MFTVCPKCALTLIVTAADLRVAQGYVRCGRCSSVFNALAQLSDERGAARGAEAASPEPEPDEPAEPPAAPRGARDEESIAEDALEFNPETTDAASVFVAAQPDPEWTAATGSFKALVAANQEAATPVPDPVAEEADGDVEVEIDAALLSDIVQSEPIPPKPVPAAAARREPAASAAREEPVPHPVAPSPVPATPSPVPAAPSPVPAAPPLAQPSAGHKRPASLAAVTPAGTDGAGEPATQLPTEDAAADEFAALEQAAAPQAARGPLLWAVGAVLLGLILVAQIIDHQRDALATDPRFNRSLTTLYAALGIQLTPRWDLHSYEVRQLGATVGQGSVGAITVRASIRNAGVRPQPPPLLRVTLQDRFGNRLASRDVRPSEYLPRSIPPTALLARDQRIDAELDFVDPGASAVGFELDACLPLAGGGIACANDASAR